GPGLSWRIVGYVVGEVGSSRKAREEGRVKVTGMAGNRVVNSGFNRGKETGE
nr:hypothetical protein [Tanacetum cinerariifolium]